MELLLERVVVLRVEPEAPAPRRAVEALRAGEVLVYPTDTVYGLGCDATRPAAVRRGKVGVRVSEPRSRYRSCWRTRGRRRSWRRCRTARGA